MLYNGRKFDIRTYVFANSINNVTKYYWYSEGYIRTSSSLYSLNDLQDNYIHLTNDAIQNTCDTYGRY